MKYFIATFLLSVIVYFTNGQIKIKNISVYFEPNFSTIIKVQDDVPSYYYDQSGKFGFAAGGILNIKSNFNILLQLKSVLLTMVTRQNIL